MHRSKISALLISSCLWLLFGPLSLAASRQAVFSSRGLVASTSSHASDVGAAILKQGGNAVDAAVAVGLALAVTWPSAGNLGGGGFALVRTAKGEAYFVDYRETAPAAADATFYLDDKGALIPDASSVGYRAVATPGTPAGLELMHKRWGRLPWKKLVEPARRLAADGFRLEESHIRMLRQNEDLLRTFPESQKIFLPGASLPIVGQTFVQKDLSRTLEQLKNAGAASFYRGATAKLLVGAMKKHQGVLSEADLKEYKVEVRDPLRSTYAGEYEVLSAPPPSSGGAVLLEILGMLAKDDLKKLGFGSAAYLHLLTESMRRAFADRSQWFGDPGFVRNPLTQLLDPKYLAKRRASIDTLKASASRAVEPADIRPEEKPETTHFTIIDADGMIVSNTYTLNGSFGSGAVAEGTGVLLNNEMDDFAAKPGTPNMYGLVQNERNAIAPRKRPLSSMTPTIISRDGKPILALGSPGGPTIINTVLQVTLNVLVHGMNIQEAVDAPRIHQQWMPDQIMWEPHGINPDTRRIMEGMGHIFSERPRFMGDAQAIYFDEARGLWSGAADSRWGGKVAVP